MTWVWGQAGGISGALIVGDVRVECTPQGQQPVHLDLLQKVHEVGPGLVIGFAGSVTIGLAMVENLRAYANGPRASYGDTPGRVVLGWQRAARREWAKASERDRKLGCELLVLGTYPPAGLLHHSAGWKLLSNTNFTPVPFSTPQPSRAQHLDAIGSGTAESPLQALLGMTAYEWWQQAQEVDGSGAATPDALGKILKHTINSVSQAGISAHVHIGWLRGGKFDLMTNDDLQANWVMPNVASDMSSFKKLARKHGFAVASARA